MAVVISDSICRDLPVEDGTDLHCYPGMTCGSLAQVIRGRPELVQCKKVVILHVGTNDVAGHPTTSFMCSMLINLHMMVRKLAGCRVVLSGLLPRFDSSVLQEMVRDVNLEMRKRLGADFLLPKRFLSGGKPMVHLYNRDGLHINTEGKKVLWISYQNIIKRS